MKIGRIFAVIVAFAMLLGTLPLAVQAAPPPEPEIWISIGWSSQEDVDESFAAGTVPAGLVWGLNAFNSLPTAISRLESGGTIYILPGAYDATVVNGTTILEILTPMTLQGVDPSGNFIENFEHPGSPEIHAIAQSLGRTSFWVAADNVSFKGLKFVPYGALSDDGVGADFVIHVTGNNFLMEHCSVVAPELRDGAVSNFNRASLLFDAEGAESAFVGHNSLIGGVWIWDGAGSGGITIAHNDVYVPESSSRLMPVYVENAHPPTVFDNSFDWGPGYSAALATYASGDNVHPDADWFFSVLGANDFRAAYVIITDMETLALKEIPARSTVIMAFGNYFEASEHAEEGDTIVAFHPRAVDGVSFDSSLLADGTTFAIPAFDGGAVIFLPKGSLPGDGVYTVNITLGDPPVGPPAGYGYIGGGYFTIEEETEGPFSEFADDIVMWFHYHGDIDLDNLAVFWYDPVAEEWVELEVTVDAANNRLIVTVNHWSYFALMDTDETPETGTGIMWLIPFGALLLLAGWGLRRRAVA